MSPPPPAGRSRVALFAACGLAVQTRPRSGAAPPNATADGRGPLGDPAGRPARAVPGRRPGRLHRHELRHGGEPRQRGHLGDARGRRSRAPAHDQQGLGRARLEPGRPPHRVRLASRRGRGRAALRAPAGRRRGRARHRHADLGREPEVAARRQAHRVRRPTVVAGAESPDETKKALEAREKTKVKARTTESRLFRFWDRLLTDDEYPHLFVVDLETKAVTDLLPGPSATSACRTGAGPSTSARTARPSSSRPTTPSRPTARSTPDLFAVSTSGGPVRNLTADNPAEDHGPVFSPDGRRGLRPPSRRPTAGRTTRGWRSSSSPRARRPSSPRLGERGRGLDLHGRRQGPRVPRRGARPREPLPHPGGRRHAARDLPRRARRRAPRSPPRAESSFSSSTPISRPPELASVALDGSGFRHLTSVNDAPHGGSWRSAR